MKARRESRGHLLLEALVASAILGIAVAGVLGASSAAHESIGRAASDQEALAFARGLVEVQQAAPKNRPEWLPGAREGTVPGHPDWRWSVVVAEVRDAGADGLAYRRATVSLAYRRKTLVLEALRW